MKPVPHQFTQDAGGWAGPRDNGESWAALSDPFAAVMLGADDLLRWSLRCASAWSTTRAGADQIEVLRRRRLAALLAHARKHSPLMRELLSERPDDAPLDTLPITGREQLMSEFDRWVTDPAVRLGDIRAFIADPTRAGEPYLGRYAVWTSSGTTGVPGIYVSDPDALAVYEALSSTRSACGGAAAPLWQPMLVSSYPSLLALLARERRAGRLRIAPQLLMSGGETLPPSQAHWLEESFDCPVRDEYGTSECMNIAWSCDEGALHLNADWAILEPVDERGKEVPMGTPSANVLLTNLANHVQPILRYPLGDRVTLLPGYCECGCPLPRLRVSGRHDDMLQLPDRTGQPVAILPLTLETLIEEQSGIGAFQVEQTAVDWLAIRIHTGPAEDRKAIWSNLEKRIAHWLDLQGVQARVALDTRLPEPNPSSGKVPRVIAMKNVPRPLKRSARPDGPTRRQRPHAS